MRAMKKRIENPGIHLGVSKYGSMAAIARMIGVSTQFIYQVAYGERMMPPARCVELEKKTKGLISRKSLRPHDHQNIWLDMRKSSAKKKAA